MQLGGLRCSPRDQTRHRVGRRAGWCAQDPPEGESSTISVTFAPPWSGSRSSWLGSRATLPSHRVGRASSVSSAQPVHVTDDAPDTPPSTCTPSIHSRAVAKPRFGPVATSHPDPVPPSWFRTTLTVSSARRVAGLLHPAADPGVHRVSADRLQADGGLPRDARFPSRRCRRPVARLPAPTLGGCSLQGPSACARSPSRTAAPSRRKTHAPPGSDGEPSLRGPDRRPEAAVGPLAGERPTRFVGSDENRSIPPRVLRGVCTTRPPAPAEADGEGRGTASRSRPELAESVRSRSRRGPVAGVASRARVLADLQGFGLQRTLRGASPRSVTEIGRAHV